MWRHQLNLKRYLLVEMTDATHQISKRRKDLESNVLNVPFENHYRYCNDLNSAMMSHHSWESGWRREKNSSYDLLDENQTWNGRNLSLNILSFRFSNLENHQKFLNLNSAFGNSPWWKTQLVKALEVGWKWCWGQCHFTALASFFDAYDYLLVAMSEKCKLPECIFHWKSPYS